MSSGRISTTPRSLRVSWISAFAAIGLLIPINESPFRPVLAIEKYTTPTVAAGGLGRDHGCVTTSAPAR